MIFVSFSVGPAAKVQLLKVQLTPDAKPVLVRLRKFAIEQHPLLAYMVCKLLRWGMIF